MLFFHRLNMSRLAGRKFNLWVRPGCNERQLFPSFLPPPSPSFGFREEQSTSITKTKDKTHIGTNNWIFFFTSIETHPVPYCTMYFDFYDILYLFVMNGGKMYHKTKACIVLKWNTVYIFYSTVHYSNYRASCIVFLEFVFNWSFSLVFIHMDHEGKTHNWLKKLYIQYTS